MAQFSRSLALLALGGTLLPLLVSCSSTKASQCQELMTAIARGSEAVNALDADRVQEMPTLAEQLDETTTRLKKLPLNDPQLREFREEAIAVSQGFSEIFRETGTALELANQVRPTREGLKTLNDTQTRLKGAIDSLEKNTKTANRLVAEVNRYCGANLP